MRKPTEGEMVLAVVEVAGFAKACHGKSDVEIFEILDRFYHLVGTVVSGAGGTVVKFMGDCAFVVFPGNKARQAVAVLRELKAAGDGLWGAVDPACRTRMHAHIGHVASGPMGLDQRFEVVGRNVNDLFLMPWDGPELSEALRNQLFGVGGVE